MVASIASRTVPVSAAAPACRTKIAAGLRPSRRPFTQAGVPESSRRSLQTVAALGGGKDDDKRFITRDEEPEQFWQTKTEQKGQNPAKDPLAIIGILGLLLPFLILGIAIGTGVVDLSAGKL